MFGQKNNSRATLPYLIDKLVLAQNQAAMPTGQHVLGLKSRNEAVPNHEGGEIFWCLG